MEDYQQRVVTEKKELDAKIVALAGFLFSDKSKDVAVNETEELFNQLHLMMGYSRVLSNRIRCFN